MVQVVETFLFRRAVAWVRTWHCLHHLFVCVSLSAQANGKYELSLKKSQKTLNKVEAWGDDRIKNRQALIANLYSCMGNAYLELNKHKEAIEYHNKDLAIGQD